MVIAEIESEILAEKENCSSGTTYFFFLNLFFFLGPGYNLFTGTLPEWLGNFNALEQLFVGTFNLSSLSALS